MFLFYLANDKIRNLFCLSTGTVSLSYYQIEYRYVNIRINTFEQGRLYVEHDDVFRVNFVL
jgi:hypothetical protein